MPKPSTAKSSSSTPALLLKRAQSLLEQRQWDGASKLLNQVLAQQPSDCGLWMTLARAQRAAGHARPWLQAAERAMQHANTDELAQQATLLAVQAAMVLNDAELALRLATTLAEPLRANQPDLLKQMGAAFNMLARPQDAVQPLMQALTQKFDDRDAYLELGFALNALQLYAEAAECFRTVCVLYPEHLGAQAYLIHLEQRACRWAEHEQRCEALFTAQREAVQLKNYSPPFVLVALPHHPAQMLEAARLAARHICRNMKPLPAPPRKPAGRRLHIGYLSNDFLSHATATLITQVLESHDRERFEISLLSHSNDDGSALRQRLTQACDRFEEMGALSLADMAKRIRELGVDILIDLKGHTAGSRMAALAYRPAPVQVAWLGFPGTCGMDEVDYIIGDPIVTPLEHAAWYSEKIAQMPHCYQPNDGLRLRPEPASRAELGLPEEALVLLSANQVYKLNPALFDVWMEILRRLPQAVLWQLSGGDAPDAELRGEVQRRGIDPARLICMPKVGLNAHLQRLGAADLALDSWPCNGHTTTSDALWAGVPVVAMQGEAFAGRVSASLLNAVGLPELVCTRAEDYVEQVCRLAADPQRRAALRQHLLAARDGSRLFDAPGFARDLERLYERMWARHNAGRSPIALPAQA
ncbi:glycosyltransferase [Roseateles sp. DAIF2]|uniref:O-linked N-acetylglucosamine transferase, SPINDLY family protein n=1 Tax=Roseateles sp. DAIF2 TaxID=2714952 RepID=UPI0018A2FDCF|nr:glycosyltransferase [Roseateles sp. DAIF2]QPF73122.1 glycosyltransferase [Roseateles sp. DAIF2]